MPRSMLATAKRVLLMLCLGILPAAAANFPGPDSYRQPALTRPGHIEWDWDGGQRLAVGVPAIVHYSEQGVPRVVITGPDDMLRHVRYGDGVIRLDNDFDSDRERLEITVTGVRVNDFAISGSAGLLLERLERESLSIKVSGSGFAELEAVAGGDARFMISGSGRIKLGTLTARNLRARISGNGSIQAKGRVDALDLVMSGSGRFGDIASSRADVTMSGSGHAAIAPRDEAHIRISGSATVSMPARPARLETTVTGPGQIQTGTPD